MGDRCTCTLVLSTEPTKELTDLILEHLDEPDEMDSPCWLTFTEVNNAELPDELVEYLTENGLAFAWMNTAGAEYGQGVHVFAPELSDKVEHFNLLDNSWEITLTVREATNQDTVIRALAWQGFLNELIANELPNLEISPVG